MDERLISSILRCGPYQLLEELGRGGMATVHRVKRVDGDDETPLALKRLRTHAQTSETVTMLVEEARVVAALQHPSIVPLLDYGRDEVGRPYLVFEWIDGLDLRHLVASRSRRAEQMPWRAAAWALIGALRGLAAAHERKDGETPHPVIHRDISPGNILVSVRGQALLADFGLARSADRTTFTPTGQVKGKIAYAAPELVQGSRATPQSDLYAAGVVLWEALAGEALFRDGNEFRLVARVLNGEISSLHEKRTDLPDELYALVHAAMSLDPKNRPKSAREMADALEAMVMAHGEIEPAELLAEEVLAARAQLGKG